MPHKPEGLRQSWLALTFELGSLVTAVVVFAALALHQIDLPGLYYDEALDAVPAMELVLGRPVELVRDAGITLFGHTYPIMAMDYVGAIHTYALVPFFTIFGITAKAIRLMTISGAILTMVLAYAFLRGLFGPVVAIGAILLYSVSPSFIFWSRQGIHVSSLMGVFLWGGLASLWRWKSTSRARWLLLASLLLGIGVSAKLLFLWFVVALGALFVGFVALDRWQGSQHLPSLNLLTGLASLALLIAGAWMVIVYNVQTGGTIEQLVDNAGTTSYGVNNLAVLANLETRAGSLQTLVNGDYFWFLGDRQSNPFWWPAFLSALIGIAVLLPFDPKARQNWRRPVILIGLLGAVFLESAFTVSGLTPTHYYALLPIPQAIVVYAAYLLMRRCQAWLAPTRLPSVSLRLIPVGIVLVLGLSDLRVDTAYHRSLTQTGGWLAHSDAVYRLADYLDREGIHQPIALDWGIKNSVQVLTAGRVTPKEIFIYAPDAPPFFTDLLYKEMVKPDSRYVFRNEEMTVYERWPDFEALAKRLQKEIHLEATIRQRDGKPIYYVYTVR